MTKDPPHKKRASAAFDAEPEENDRPTVNPPFDVEAYAKATTADPPPSGVEPKTAPPPAPTDEPPARSQQPTLTNEAEIEAARVRSAQVIELPPGRLPSGLLSFADLRVASPIFPEPGPFGADDAGIQSSNIEAAVLDVIRGSSPAPEITERTIEDPIAEMRERASLGDYTGALEMAELILAGDPSNLEAAECAENCRSVLEKMYSARLGSSEGVPVVVVPQAQMQWLSIDHRAGFVLSLIDGSSTLEMIIDVSGMPRLDALRILHALVQQRIVAFKT